MMIEKIGKWALIWGTIINILLLLLGIGLVYNGRIPMFFYVTFLYPLAMCTPLFVAILCILLGGICSKISRKSKDKAVENSNVAIFFRSYFYLWLFVATLIAISGFIFLYFNVYLEEGLVFTVVASGFVAWLGSVIVCILIWSAFNTWKNSEIVGVILVFISLIILIGSGVIAGFIYQKGNDYAVKSGNENSTHSDGGYEYGAGNGDVDEDDEDDDSDEDDEYDEDDDSTDSCVEYNRAYRFFKHRLDFKNSSDPMDLLCNWKYYSWKEDTYRKDNPDFSSKKDFKKCFNSFYAEYDKCRTDEDDLMSIYGCYAHGCDISADVYKKTGAQLCVKLLLWSHDDIYSHSNSETLLNEMYSIMCENITEDNGDVMVSYRYPKLLPYISAQMIEKTKGIGELKDNDWRDKFLRAWAYSFWARRHNDGVDQMAHQILEMIDEFYTEK